jgi:hypothetical protein
VDDVAELFGGEVKESVRQEKSEVRF